MSTLKTEKELNDFSIKELGQLFPIIIKDYLDKWPDLYNSEAKSIVDSFSQKEILKIDHIGSTAIPGLMPRPHNCLQLKGRRSAVLAKKPSSLPV